MDAFGSVMRGYQAGQQNKLARLSSQAYATPEEGRQALLGQIAAVSPEAAQAQQGQFEQQEDRTASQLQGLIGYVNRARATNNPQAVNAALRAASPFITKLTGKPAPTEWTPDMDEGWAQLEAQVSQRARPERTDNKVVGRALVGPNGEVIYEAPADPVNAQYVDVPDGRGGLVKMVFDPRTRQFTQPSFGGPAQHGMPEPAPQPIPQSMPSGQPVNIEEGLSPEQMEAVRADIAANGASDSYQLPPRAGNQFQNSSRVTPGMGYTPPKGPSEIELERLRLAQDAARRADQAAARAERGNPPSGYRWSADGQSLERIPGAPTASSQDKPPTEGERNASGYFQRMSSAESDMDATIAAGYRPGGYRDAFTAGQGALLNPLATPEGQNYRQQQEDWVRAKLRKESGAAIGDAEMEREISTYFPQPGDGPGVIEKKKKSRMIAIDAMRQAGGRALAAEQSEQPSAAPRQIRSAAEYEALPAGSQYVDPNGVVRRKR